MALTPYVRPIIGGLVSDEADRAALTAWMEENFADTAAIAAIASGLASEAAEREDADAALQEGKADKAALDAALDPVLDQVSTGYLRLGENSDEDRPGAKASTLPAFVDRRHRPVLVPEADGTIRMQGVTIGLAGSVRQRRGRFPGVLARTVTGRVAMLMGWDRDGTTVIDRLRLRAGMTFRRAPALLRPAISDALGRSALAVEADGSVALKPSAYTLDRIRNALHGVSAISCWGDSLTEGGHGGGTNYPAALARHLGRLVYNRGSGGQQWDEIAARQGAYPITVTVSGDEIPASGGVSVTAKSINILYRNGTYQGTAKGTIAGVEGTMSTDASGNWMFTRTSAGSVTPAPEGSQFSLLDAPRHRGETCIFWVGRNPNPTDWDDALNIRNALLAMVAHLTPRDPRYLVVSVTPRASESGSSTLDLLSRINADLARVFGDRFIDLAGWLINDAIYELGITPDSGDLADMAAGVIPGSLLYDDVHFISDVYEAIGQYIGRIIQAKGW